MSGKHLRSGTAIPNYGFGLSALILSVVVLIATVAFAARVGSAYDGGIDRSAAIQERDATTSQEVDESKENDDSLENGAKIYAAQCASCHGEKGEGGTEDYRDPFEGDVKLEDLIDYVHETMPDDDPDLCLDDDARDVSRFIHETFYRARAEAARRNVRIQLSRLTVSQYRESLTDLGSVFAGESWIGEKRGLNAKIVEIIKANEKNKKGKRVDANVDFDFGEDGPLEDEQLESYSIDWQGGLIVPETGEYEFTVATSNGFKLFINDYHRTPVLDRWVKSGDETEHTLRMFLIGGRAYAFGLDFLKLNDPTGSVQLKWRTPSSSETVVIPRENFVPQWIPPVAVISTPFPADDSSSGYARGTSVSREWDKATTSAAIEFANWCADRLPEFAELGEEGGKTIDDPAERTKRVRTFCQSFATRALRRHLSDEENEFFIDRHFGDDVPLTDSVKRVIILTLKSPRFLYPQIGESAASGIQNASGFAIASRMSLAMWDSIPDDELFQDAAAGNLSEEKLEHHLYRMVENSRAKRKLNGFLHFWLQSKPADEISKDANAFPGFDDQMVRDLQESLQKYLDEIVWSEKSDFRQLFLSDHTFANQRIAEFYNLDNGSDESADDTTAIYRRLKFDPARSAGVLTHPYLMAGLAYHRNSSPIHRGVFVARNLLGRSLKQPPDDVEPLSEEFNPEMTTRQRVEHQTRETTCMNCHAVINPLGFCLENFDAVGRYRTEEKQRPIDVSGVYETSDDEMIELKGPRDLGNFLANNALSQRSFIRHLFQHYIKQPIDAYGDDTLDNLHNHFVNNEFNIRELVIAIVLVAATHEIDQ